MLEMKSQSTKAGYGSKVSSLTKIRFPPSHKTVHVKITRKNPIVPIWSVIQTAKRSSLVNRSLCSMFMFLIGLRALLSSASASGLFSSIWIYTITLKHTVHAPCEHDEQEIYVRFSLQRLRVCTLLKKIGR